MLVMYRQLQTLAAGTVLTDQISLLLAKYVLPYLARKSLIGQSK